MSENDKSYYYKPTKLDNHFFETMLVDLNDVFRDNPKTAQSNSTDKNDTYSPTSEVKEDDTIVHGHVELWDKAEDRLSQVSTEGEEKNV